jgi:hypothetical protein
VRIDGEINAEEQHNQGRADCAEHRHCERGGTAGDTPWAELIEQLGDANVLEQIAVVRGRGHLFGERGHAGGDAGRDLRGLLCDLRPRPDHDEDQKAGDEHHHDEQRDEPRHLGEVGKRVARAIKRDGEKDAGEAEKDRGARVPQRGGDGDDDDETDRGADGAVGHRGRQAFPLADSHLFGGRPGVGHSRILKRERVVGHSTPKPLRRAQADTEKSEWAATRLRRSP